MKTFTFLIFLVILTAMTIFAQNMPPIEAGVPQSLAKWRAANYDDVRYKLNITLEKGAPLMKGEIEIRVNLTEEGAKNDLILDWRTTQFENNKDKPYAKVLTVNEEKNHPEVIIKEHIKILRSYLKTGENIIKIEFASPIKTSGAAITRYVDKEDGAEYVYSLFVPSDASTAFPVFDQPDLKARFQLNLTIPEEWNAVSNTNGNSIRGLGLTGVSTKAIYNFPETKPISTYVFAFAAGDFAEFEDKNDSQAGAEQPFPTCKSGNVEWRNPTFSKVKAEKDKLNKFAGQEGLLCARSSASKIYVRKSQAEKFKAHAKEVFRLNREGIKFLESYFDYKFPFPKYDIVLIPEFPFGGMEHAGSTFLREDRVIFPTEPTKNDFVTRANVIFHEAAHQWFGDTVTMRWFDDLWLKEGFAEFMAYKTLEKVMPEYNAWKIFYERNKQAAYLTDSTKGTTPIYQEIPNLSAAKSAYGNIVYRKAPSFLKQAEFYLGEDKFQTAVRAFLKKHEFANAEWTDLVKEFETASGKNSIVSFGIEDDQEWKIWGETWVKKRGVLIVRTFSKGLDAKLLGADKNSKNAQVIQFVPTDSIKDEDVFGQLPLKFKTLVVFEDGSKEVTGEEFSLSPIGHRSVNNNFFYDKSEIKFIFPNYQDYGYGIFLLDEKSRDYVLKNIQNEKDDFLRTMMWGALWDSVRETELAPKDYVELVIKNISVETDESTIQTLLGRVSTAMNYYLSEPPAVAGGLTRPTQNAKTNVSNAKLQPSATADGSDLSSRLEAALLERIANAKTPGQRITFYRAYLNLASSENAKQVLKEILSGKSKVAVFQLKTKDKFDIVTRLLILGDKNAPGLLLDLEKSETSDEAKRYAYAARAGIGAANYKAKYFKDFMTNKEISESWIEAALAPFNSVRHSELTLPYLETALAELPNLKKNRKIFFVNGWLGAFIGGQKSEEALAIVNKFLTDNPNLDKDLRLKILENVDGLERAVKIRAKYGK